MTDHLEPYRRMARSIRFFPPSALALKPIPQPIPQPATPSSLVDSWAKKISYQDHVQPIEPPIDPSEHAASLVHEAVWKPTVLPATYTIPENIGDRISRLAVSSSVGLVINPTIPQPTLNGTVAQTSGTYDAGDRLVYDVHRQVYALASTIVEPTVEVEETSTEEPVAVVEPTVEVEETSTEEPVAVVEPTVEETSTDIIADTDTLVEVEDTQPPTLLEKVSSVIEAVSTAFMNPEVAVKANEAEAKVEPVSSSETIETPATENHESLTKEADELVPAPSLLDRVSAVVEAVATTLKNPDSEPKNLQIVEATATPEKALDSKTTAITCPACESTELRKNGRRQGKQRYACKDCGRQFAIADNQIEAKLRRKESASVETSNLNPPQPADLDVSENTSDAAKSGSKKKKAKGFGASKRAR